MQIFTAEDLSEILPTDKSPESEESIIPKYFPAFLDRNPTESYERGLGQSHQSFSEKLRCFIGGGAKQLITNVSSTFTIYEK